MPDRTPQRRPSPARRRTRVARGFTLLELIISVALTLVLMLAITRIFSITSDAVGASQGLAAATRDARAAQAVFARDIAAMANDSPFIWIKYEGAFSAFRNLADELSDKDNLPLTVDLNNNGIEGESAVPGENTPGYLLTARRHRLDFFSFFVRDRFSRQTGNSTGSLVAPMTSPEAWVYYGSLALPNNDGTFQLGSGGRTNPGAGNNLADNPNNYYASQWILGRFAPLMALRSTASPFNITDSNGVAQEFFTRIAGTRMRPFTSATPATAGTLQMRSARYDLIDVDMNTATNVITSAMSVPTPAWYTQIMNEHLEVNPFVIKPISPASASRQVPLFLSAVSQFVVEFAGDFVTQDTTGAVTNYASDGVLDYGTIDGTRTIRWYGYPRDVDGDGTINATLRDTNGDSVLDTTGPDVVTVSDFALPVGQLYFNAAAPAANPYVRFEHFGTTAAVTRKSYTGTPSFGNYYAVWGPDSVNNADDPRPKMYRISLTIDRPEMAGRTSNGVSFEYVFNAP